MKWIVFGLVALSACVVGDSAQASKILPFRTITLLTDELVKQYVACRPKVEQAVKAAERSEPGTGRGASVRRRRLAYEARDKAEQECGFPQEPEGDLYRAVQYSILAVFDRRPVEKVLVREGQPEGKSVDQVQRANRQLLRKYTRAQLLGRAG